MAELKRSMSKGLPQTGGPGEVLLKIAKETQNLFNIQNLSPVSVSDYLRKSLRSLTGSSWVEVFFEEDSTLCLYKSLQTSKSIPIDKNSLPGYTALSQEPQSINNASSSSFYNSFNIQYHPYVLPSKEIVQASSVACIPIMKDGVTRLVLLLYNKLDESNSLAYFSENDFAVAEALGIWAVTSLDIYLYCSDLRKQLQHLNEQNKEGNKLTALGVESVYRRSALEKCLKVLQHEARLTRNSFQQISHVMKCQGVIFHIYSQGSLKPIIALGLENYDPKALTNKTADYCLFSSKEILNVNDLAAEPLWDQDKLLKMKCLLTCPIINKEAQPLGCIEYFRKNSQFSPVDENYAKKISEMLSNISEENFVPNMEQRNSIDKTLGNLFKELNSFVLSTEEMYDFPKIFSEIRESIRNLMILDSCGIYIANQVKNVFWTRQSENCDVLSQPIFEDNLFGYVYSKQSKIVLPDDIPVSDLSSYDKFGIVQPVVSSLSLYPVIGLITVFRGQKPFNKDEQDVLEKIAQQVTLLLESLWIYRNDEKDHYFEKAVVSLDSSPEIRFRVANARRGAPTSIHYLSDQVEEILKPTPTLKSKSAGNLYSLTLISTSRLSEIKSMMQEMKTRPDSAILILAKRLRQLIPCQYSKLYLMDSHEQHFVDAITNTLATPSGLLNLCMKTQEPICIRFDAFQNPSFDKHLDSLGGDSKVESFLAMPIVVQERSLGVIAFANASINFGPEDIAIAEFVSLIPKEYIAKHNENIKDLSNAIQMGRRHKMLQQWCKQVFFVSNSTQTKIALVRDILHKLYEEKNFEKLIKAGLEMLCALINAEQSAIIFEENGEFVEFLFKKSKLVKRSHLEDEGLIRKALDSMRPISLENLYGKENIIVVPYAEKGMPKVVLKAYDKRDDTLSYYCNFNKEDEQTLIEFSECISHSFVSRDKNESPEKLKQFIREYASNLNTHSLISTIRMASQKLLDCDRATVFIIEGKEMIVKAQGMEKEIPGGFRIPIGKGIIGNVAQTGQTENIKDVYEDPRFDPAMDKMTGYRTQTMLCMPVLDTQGKVIAALQMINKKKGNFDESDEETLVIFSEIISSALQNCSLFMHTITERSRILNILNSIGNFIIVFNNEGIMEYSNKSIKGVFGISKKFAFKSHYSSWLRDNRQLVLDITSTIQNPSKKIIRKSQKLVSATFKRTRTSPNIARALQTDSKNMYFNYFLAGVQAFNNTESMSVALILEDVSDLEELNSKLEKVQKEVQSMKSSIYGETSLQKCIQKLSGISRSIEDPEAKTYLDDVIRTLKQGNLNSADIMSQLPIMQGYSTKAISEYIGLETLTESQRHDQGPRIPSRSHSEIIESSVLTDLRDINLDPFAIDDHFTYVKAMFQDFYLMDQMDIKQDVLLSFLNRVKDHYSVWDNPFHNFYHGFNVLHATYLLLSTTQAGMFFSAQEIFALFIASLCHDLEHPGRTNNFEINRSSNLALIYNDRSVLENHHCAVTFKILQEEKSNLIANFEPDLKKSFRKLVVVAILGTDMSKHVEVITQMTSRLKDTEESPLMNSDLEGLASLLLHSADLSHPCKTFDNYQKWSKRVCDEFTQQYQEEVRLGLPPTEIMKDLDKPEVYYASEFGFLKFVIKPLWDCINLWLNPHINPFIENIHDNIERYQKLKEENPKKSN